MTDSGPTEIWTSFSLAERDRRWNAVRRNAVAAGFDCILVPPCVDGRNLRISPENSRGTRSDCRYLTQMENAAVIFPTDGRATVVINDRGIGNKWIAEARPVAAGTRGPWAPAVAEALLDLGMERARIGVTGLQGGRFGHVRASDGTVTHRAYTEIQRHLPNARFENATDIVGSCRYVKSEEEIACLKRAATITAAGIKEMIDVARAGVEVALLYASITRRMLELGNEFHPWNLEIGPIGATSTHFEDPPMGQRLRPMDLITNEIYAVSGGLAVQDVQPIVLGPIPDKWKPVIDVQGEAFETGREFMRPGKSFRDLVGVVNHVGARRGMRTAVMLHSRGYGNEGPYVNPQDGPSDVIQDVHIEKNTVWIWKPHAYSADGQIYFRWGTSILVTDKGGEPLINRPHGMVSIAGNG